MHLPFLTVAAALTTLIHTSFADSAADAEKAAAAKPKVKAGSKAKVDVPEPPNRKIAKNLALTDEELKQYNGEDESKPIYLAIDGNIYDVSAQPGFYGPKGAYGHFAGRDATRAWVTECWDTPDQLTWRMDDVEIMFTPRYLDEEVELSMAGGDADFVLGEYELTQFRPVLEKALKKMGKVSKNEKKLRRTTDLKEAQQKVAERVAHWSNFFKNNNKYHNVGKVVRKPDDSDTPTPPAPCASALAKRILKPGKLADVELPSGPIKTASQTQPAKSKPTAKDEL